MLNYTGMRNLGLKTRNKIVILGTVFGSVLLCFGATVFFIPNAYAINNTEAIGGLAATFDLGNPFYIQHYQYVVKKPQSESQPNLYVNHTNDGVINGSLIVTQVGNTTETLRNNNTVYLQGFRNLMAEPDMGGGTATYHFQAIGNYGPDKTYESRGVAIFDKVATGKLSFLGNSFAIYKVRVDADGNGTFLMWQWK
ncbi:MAG: hypothetical protein ACJ72S_11360 [Nitrososphaeraceae archaeon]